MNVNPYLTPEYDPPSASPTRACGAKSEVVGGRKTNRLAIAGAGIGVFVGLWTAGIQYLGGLSDLDFGRAMGGILFHVHVCAIAGYVLVWLPTMFFTRPRLAMFIIGGVAAIGGLFAARRGLPSTDSILPSWSAPASKESVPAARNGLVATDSIPSATKPTDLARHSDPARHKEARRVQYKDEAFSVILPPNWDEETRESDEIIYAGSTGVAFFGSLGMKVHPKPLGRLTFEAIQGSIAKNVPGFVSVIEHGNLTIDERQALFVACRVRLKGRNLRQVFYLVPGKSKLYELTVCCLEPPTVSSRNTLTGVVNSLRVD